MHALKLHAGGGMVPSHIASGSQTYKNQYETGLGSRHSPSNGTKMQPCFSASVSLEGIWLEEVLVSPDRNVGRSGPLISQVIGLAHTPSGN